MVRFIDEKGSASANQSKSLQGLGSFGVLKTTSEKKFFKGILKDVSLMPNTKKVTLLAKHLDVKMP